MKSDEVSPINMIYGAFRYIKKAVILPNLYTQCYSECTVVK